MLAKCLDWDFDVQLPPPEMLELNTIFMADWSIQGQVGQDSEQPEIVEVVPAHGMGVEWEEL